MSNPSEKLIKVIKFSFSLSSFVYVFYSILELTYFLSVPKEIVKTKGDPWVESSSALVRNMFLLSLFVIQHSAMATQTFKQLLDKWRLGDIARTIYVSTTASVLLVIIRYWQPTTQAVLWDLNLNYRPLLFLYIGVHVTAWTIIYVANVCTDVTELLGLKQMYYSLINLPDPNLRKSYQLQKLSSHMRHPSFLGFLLVFWFFPLMTLDRILLATILTSYMYIAWNTDGDDYNYQRYMYQRKYHELQRLTSH